MKCPTDKTMVGHALLKGLVEVTTRAGGSYRRVMKGLLFPKDWENIFTTSLRPRVETFIAKIP